MFITKKRFEEEVAKAVQKREEEMWQHERIRRLEDSFYERIHELEKKIYNLELAIKGEPDNALKCECDGVACAPVKTPNRF